MIKMKSHHPLLVGGEARTEFETDEQHARELEFSGLAARVLVDDLPPTAIEQAGPAERIPLGGDSHGSLEPTAAPAATPEPARAPELSASAPVAGKSKRAK